VKIRVDEITHDRGRLVLGCVVEGPAGAWIRFSLAQKSLDERDYAVLLEALRWSYDVGPGVQEDQATLF
jgi:hypothetical protein